MLVFYLCDHKSQDSADVWVAVDEVGRPIYMIKWSNFSQLKFINWSNFSIWDCSTGQNHEQNKKKTYRVDNPSWLLGEFTLHSSSRALLADKPEIFSIIFLLIMIVIFVKVFVFTTTSNVS